MHKSDEPTFAVSFDMPSQSTGPSVIGRPRDAPKAHRKAVGQFLRLNPFSAQPGMRTRTRDSGDPPICAAEKAKSPRELDIRCAVCSCGQASTIICANAWGCSRLSPRKSFSPRSIPRPMEMLPHASAASAWCPTLVVRSSMFDARCSLHARQCSSACPPATSHATAHTRNFRKDATQFDCRLRLIAKHSMSCLALDFASMRNQVDPLRSVTMFVFFQEA